MKSLEWIQQHGTTAVVRHGVTMNSVTVKKKRKPKAQPKRLWKRELSEEGAGTSQLCVSFPDDLLAEVDAAATRFQMSRSRFLRQAAKHFIATVKP